MDADIQALNTQHAIPGQLSFQSDANGQVTVLVKNAYAEAAISLLGGQVLSYRPHGEEDVLWVGPNANAVYPGRVAMRGGIPICWPWFAMHPTADPHTKPPHGFVRGMPWSVAGTRACSDGSTEVRLVVGDTPATRDLWPHPFVLEETVTIGQKLRLELVASSQDDEGFAYTGALHTYFRISDIQDITIYGLENTDYLDKTDQFRRKTQTGPLKITGLTDGIFLDTTEDVMIQDPGYRRTIHVAKEGSRTTVVWNPAEKDSLIPDVGAGQHRFFVCAETANAADDVVRVPPGGAGRLVAQIWTEQGAES